MAQASGERRNRQLASSYRARLFQFLLVVLIPSMAAGPVLAAQVCEYNSVIATAPANRFTDNGDGTVTDKVTDLQWKRCSEGQTWSGNTCTGSAATYAVYTWQAVLQLADSASYAGHNDWRLPNIKELASIIELACYDPAIDLSVFPATDSGSWWTSTPNAWAYADSIPHINKVDFLSGVYDFNYGQFVRLVRGSAKSLNDTGMTWWATDWARNLGSEPTDYPGQDASYGRDVEQPDNSDGRAGFSFTKLDANGNPLPADAESWSCVKDNITGLIWEIKTDNGGLRDWDWTYTWYNPDPTRNGGFAGYPDPGAGGASTFGNSNNCFDPSRCDTLKFVQDVNQSELCGATDWRIPGREELHSIEDYSGADGIDKTWFPNLNGNYWSSSTDVHSNNSAWYVTTYTAFPTKSVSKGWGNNIRLVRGGGDSPSSPPPSEEKVPVVLVHGINGNAYTFGDPLSVTCAGTQPYLIPGCEPMLEQLLEQHGFKVETFDYSSKTHLIYNRVQAIFQGNWTIEQLAGELAIYICEEVKKGKFNSNGSCSIPGSVDIVAHSMGGLIARAYIAGMAVDRSSDGVTIPYDNGAIRKLVMIATPNYGAPRAGLENIFNFLGPLKNAIIGKQLDEMEFGSKFIWDLNQKWQVSHLPKEDMLVIAGTTANGEDDDGVVPVASTTLPVNYLSNIRYVPYSHMGDIAYIQNEQHLTYMYVLPFLLGESIPQQVDYSYLDAITQEGLLLVRLADSKTKTPISPENFETGGVVISGIPVVLDGELVPYNQVFANTANKAGTITVWPINNGQHALSLMGSPKGYSLPENYLTVEINGARPTSTILWLTRINRS